MRPFAQNLKKVRTHWGMTQGQIAIKMGIKKKTYEAYEEDRAQPPAEIIASICTLYQITDVPAFLTKEEFQP